MTRTIASILAAILLCAAFAMGQAQGASAGSDQGVTISDKDINMLRQDIRSQKKQIIAQNLPLTDAEAQKFWPAYDRYIADLVKVNNTKYDLIKQYAQSYGTMTDAQASSWAQQLLDLDENVAALRKRYLPEFQKVLPGKKAALYVQIERRAQMMIDMQLASQIPLIDVGQ
ncbi:MAG TPA: hypothetical protein VF753_12675 [Terriglobales bacterium]